MIVVRPGVSMEPGILLALGAGAAFAFYVIATRQASQSAEPLVTLNFQYVFGALLLTPVGLVYFSVPVLHVVLLVALMGAISLTGHLLSIIAFKYAQASTLAPLIYVELVGSVAVGYCFFGDFPSALTWIGIVIIVMSGLLLINFKDSDSSLATKTNGHGVNRWLSANAGDADRCRYLLRQPMHYSRARATLSITINNANCRIWLNVVSEPLDGWRAV